MDVIPTSALVERGSLFLSVFVAALLFCYVVYQRFLHPLAKYPGPLLASLTDLWQVNEFLSQRQTQRLTALHHKYGPIVRYGPDKISVTQEESIRLVYPNSGGKIQKTEFYDAFGGMLPNLFALRNEAEHGRRRRYMSHSFSLAQIKLLEEYIDENIKKLVDQIQSHIDKNEAFDLHKLVEFCIVDILGDLAYSQSFELQSTQDASRGPRIADHVLITSAMAAWPSMMPTLKKLTPKLPWKWLQEVIKGRDKNIQMANECVTRRLREIGEYRKDDKLPPGQRKDLLTNLIMARDPDTKEHLSDLLLKLESFTFIIAGTHSTSATISFLLWNLLHNPEYLTQCEAEADEKLPALGPGESAYGGADAENSLPYLKKCVTESFRITPVFTMPLARRVLDPAGLEIAGNHFPQGTSLAVCNYAFHHNADVWGQDHNVYNPARFDDKEMAERSKLLMHFGFGHRQCIGKNMATTNIYKVTSTLLRTFSFELADETERTAAAQGKLKGTLPEMVSVGFNDLNQPMMVRAKRRMVSEKA